MGCGGWVLGYLLFVGLVVSVTGWPAFLCARIVFRILVDIRTRVIWVSDLVVDRSVSAVMDPIDRSLLRMTGQPRPPKPEENKDEVIEARAVLGLPERFTKADVNARGRHLSKQTHPDQGGTNWLQARVNWAVGSFSQGGGGMKAEFLLWLGVAMIMGGLAVGIVRHEWPILAFLVGGTMALSLSDMSKGKL